MIAHSKWGMTGGRDGTGIRRSWRTRGDRCRYCEGDAPPSSAGASWVCPGVSFERTFSPAVWPHRTTVPMSNTKRIILRSPTPIEARKSFCLAVIRMVSMVDPVGLRADPSQGEKQRLCHEPESMARRFP
jgi:hypothetical protein